MTNFPKLSDEFKLPSVDRHVSGYPGFGPKETPLPIIPKIGGEDKGAFPSLPLPLPR